MNALARAWARRGRDRVLCGRRIFTVDIPARGGERLPPLLVLHGFPSSSFDFHQVADRLAEQRRVLLYDMLGYGLSEKPDVAYSFPLQADIAVALVADLGIERLGLLTHDVGDTLGGELLARQLEGRWPVTVTDRALTNGSIYYDLTRLSAGQIVLLALPDAQLSADTAPDRVTVMAGVAATFSPDAAVGADELAAQGEMITNDDGQRLLPRLVRYIEERRRDEARFTGAIEGHPSPLTVVWGRDDPIAVAAMAYRLARARPDLRLQWLDGVGHYPMVEAPDRFLDALGAGGFGVASLAGGSGGAEDLAVDGDEPPIR